MICAKLNNKKGFSLAELVVVLALVAIVFACLIGMVTLINNNIKANKENIALLNELESTKDFVEDWFNTYDDDTFTILSVSSTSIVFQNASSEIFSLVASETKIETSTGQEKLFSKIESVSFVQNNTTNIIKCTFTYSTNKIFSFLLNKNS